MRRVKGAERRGGFIVSLDFELYWGVRDKRRLADYRANLEGVWEAIPGILKLFRSFDVHATWATVGLVMCADRAEALRFEPAERPTYANGALSPYPWLEGMASADRRCHFAPELVAAVLSTPGQELASHTFSHYYCLEPGQTA